MRRRALLFCFVLCGLWGCKKDENRGLSGSGVQAKKTRNVPAFTRLRAGGMLSVWVSIGKDGPMELKGDDNLLDHVTARLENGVLKLDTDTRVHTKMPLELRLSTAALDAVSAVVASKVEVSGLKAKKFEAHAGGAGRITASGTAEELVVTGNGATRLDLTQVPASRASVILDKASTARFGYLEKLDVQASGASRVVYQGEPEIRRKVTPPARVVRASN